MISNQGILKKGKRSLSGVQPYLQSHIEVSYCTFGFGTIILGAMCTYHRYCMIHSALTICDVIKQNESEVANTDFKI